ncbi:MAG: 2: subgroup of nucleoside hydrolase [Adhaeribacter sp.]|nr:2: subgroup of nucleoside hydrolase [Adhaeribacter sp.]
MKKTCSFLYLILFLNTVGLAQLKVILDADIDSDVDDVEALVMVHTLADQKKIDFLGVIVTSDDPYAAVCTSAINKYFGRPRLPIGVLKNQANLKNHSRYTRQVAAEFPHALKSHDKAKDATAVYRKLLSQSPDSSVVIITIGHLSNLQNLLKSGSDKYSGLTGKELVNKKVAKWLCMGGQFPEGKEANFYRPDPGSTVYCLQNWEKPVIFAGWEVGDKIKTGGEFLKKKLTPVSPVYRAYELYNNFKGRASWDQVAVFLLTAEAGKYFEVINGGYCLVNADGSNKWVPGEASNQAYVQFKPGVNYEEIGRLMDDMNIK